MRRVFTADVVVDTTASGGGIATGADAFVEFLRATLDGAVTVHHGHMPEIDITSPATATGIWALQDVIVWPDGTRLHGYGHYHETYRASRRRVAHRVVDADPTPHRPDLDGAGGPCIGDARTADVDAGGRRHGGGWDGGHRAAADDPEPEAAAAGASRRRLNFGPAVLSPGFGADLTGGHQGFTENCGCAGSTVLECPDGGTPQGARALMPRPWPVRRRPGRAPSRAGGRARSRGRPAPARRRAPR